MLPLLALIAIEAPSAGAVEASRAEFLSRTTLFSVAVTEIVFALTVPFTVTDLPLRERPSFPVISTFPADTVIPLSLATASDAALKEAASRSVPEPPPKDTLLPASFTVPMASVPARLRTVVFSRDRPCSSVPA